MRIDQDKIEEATLILIDSWKHVLLKAWSVWIYLLIAAGEVLTLVIPFLLGMALPAWVSLGMVGLAFLGILARITKQKNLPEGSE